MRKTPCADARCLTMCRGDLVPLLFSRYLVYTSVKVAVISKYCEQSRSNRLSPKNATLCSLAPSGEQRAIAKPSSLSLTSSTPLTLSPHRDSHLAQATDNRHPRRHNVIFGTPTSTLTTTSGEFLPSTLAHRVFSYGCCRTTSGYRHARSRTAPLLIRHIVHWEGRHRAGRSTRCLAFNVKNAQVF